MENIPVDQSSWDITPKQFKDKLIHLTQELKRLLKLNESLSSLGPGDHLVFPDGTNIGRREFRSIQAQYVQQLTELGRYFTQAKKKPKKVKRVNRHSGFDNAAFMTENFRLFFMNAELGPAYVAQIDDHGQVTFVQGERLHNYLDLFLKHGITSQALLTPLFIIYVTVNKLQDLEHKSILHATPLMMKYLSSTFEALALADQEKHNKNQVLLDQLISISAPQDQIEAAQKEVNKLIFQPEKFMYNRLMSIVAHNRIPKTSITPEQIQQLKDSQLLQRLTEEQQIVSSTLAYYRNQKREISESC